MFNYFIEAFTKHYLDFSGRARRAEFWYFYLCWALVYVVLGIIASQITAVSYVMGLFFVATILPAIALSVRRMHDTDHSGWWMFVPLMNIIYTFSAGTHGTNTYGADPKAGAA
ncbi:MAG TPA: DUF805 domain-containing protein [Rhizomicrobium sp.]|nr:DUF805 domain-containing protein [Rhizomicrobium sp.]